MLCFRDIKLSWPDVRLSHSCDSLKPLTEYVPCAPNIMGQLIEHKKEKCLIYLVIC